MLLGRPYISTVFGLLIFYLRQTNQTPSAQGTCYTAFSAQPRWSFNLLLHHLWLLSEGVNRAMRLATHKNRRNVGLSEQNSSANPSMRNPIRADDPP